MKNIILLTLCGVCVGVLPANAILFIPSPISNINDGGSSLSFNVDINGIINWDQPFSNFDGGGTIDFTIGQSIVVTFSDPHTDTIEIATGTPVDNGPLYASSITPDGNGEYTITYNNNTVPEGGNTLVLLSLAVPALWWVKRRTAIAAA